MRINSIFFNSKIFHWHTFQWIAFDFLSESGTTIPVKISSGRQLNILDPLWLITMQRQVLEVDQKFVDDGKISIESLAHFSHKCGLTKQLDDYLDLIEQLEIAVRVDMNRFVWATKLVSLPQSKLHFQITQNVKHFKK